MDRGEEGGVTWPSNSASRSLGWLVCHQTQVLIGTRPSQHDSSETASLIPQRPCQWVQAVWGRRLTCTSYMEKWSVFASSFAHSWIHSWLKETLKINKHIVYKPNRGWLQQLATCMVSQGFMLEGPVLELRLCCGCPEILYFISHWVLKSLNRSFP